MELEYIFVALGCVAIAVIAYTAYLNTIAKVTVPAKTLSGSKATEPIKFIFFFSTWCPWSKKARPQWDEFRDEMKAHPVTFGGHSVQLEEYDGDLHEDLLKAHEVKGYPGFVLVTPDGDKHMNEMPTKETFRKFLVACLGAEETPKLPSGSA